MSKGDIQEGERGGKGNTKGGSERGAVNCLPILTYFLIRLKLERIINVYRKCINLSTISTSFIFFLNEKV